MKLLFALSAALLAVAAASFFVLRAAPSVAPCDTRVLVESLSPSGKSVAEIVELRCGSTVSTHVGLRVHGAPAKSRRDVFVASGHPAVAVSWRDDRELVIETPATRVLREETAWRDVGVRLRVR